MLTATLFEYLKTSTDNEEPLANIIIVENDAEAMQALEMASFLGIKAMTLPDFRASYLDDLRSYKHELNELFLALYEYYNSVSRPLLISPIKTLFHKFPNKELLQKREIAFGDTLGHDAFKAQMLNWGYTFVDIVQMEGEISFRGDIVDVYCVGLPQPIRLSFFDDEIESIRYFDLDSQKSDKEELESFSIFPAFLALSDDQHETLTHTIETEASESFSQDIESIGFWYLKELSSAFVMNQISIANKDFTNIIEDAYGLDCPQIERAYFDSVEIMNEAVIYKPLQSIDVAALIEFHKEKDITVISRNETALKQEDLFRLKEHGKKVKIIQAGYTFSVISSKEMIVSINHKVKKTKKRKASILLDELKPGDYVVHEDYGVALFESITQTTILGATKDFVSLRYQGEDRVLVPVDSLQVIDRYVADSGSLPAVDRLGKGSFSKLKDKVKNRLFLIAGEIISLAASRALLKAPLIETDDLLIRNFQKTAGFDYTNDQKRSVNEIFEEMASGRVMDRLLSGDVGFGKTEVAMNTIIATAKAGFQSVLVVPTTLLSFQHFKSIKERLEAFDIKMARLDRFTSVKEKKSILEALAEGTLDLVIGTHALFGVKVKSLGLVIIDEEHKFGVKQKEKLKELYENAHLLSMSATPIPRSLNMALSQIKTMSQLLTPPMERKGVRTFVKAFDMQLIKEVIKREQRRGGQLFYVFNNIAHMEGKKNQLLEMMPDLKIVTLHSQVASSTMEKMVLDFSEGKYDVMVATSIIESGIHMPNVNSMIIDGADRFGIADLHQLRGRVGRGDVEGYCYFLVEDKETLTPESTKRLLALESNSYLGSGQALAYQDLEIRGGGNLIGDAQSGHIKQIGYSLYLRMLEDAISTLSNDKPQQRANVDLKLSVSAFISDRIVSEDRLRIELYRRLSQADTPKEVYEIEEEVIDRFGALDTPTKQFFELMVIKLMALDKEIKIISNYNENIMVEFQNSTKKSLKSRSKDDDDILSALLNFLRS